MVEEPLQGSLTAVFVFKYKRPKSHFRTGANSHLLKRDAPQHPVAKPDLDNIIKAYLDILTVAGVIKDDCQVIRLEACKVYAERPCAEIEVWSNG